MAGIFYIFSTCFNQNIGGWNIINVIEMYGMFTIYNIILKCNDINSDNYTKTVMRLSMPWLAIALHDQYYR